MIIIGSTALKYWFPEDYPREPNDLDIVVEDKTLYSNVKGTEYFENPVLLQYNKGLDYITKENLLALKISHLFWDTNWDKHLYDVQFLLSKKVEVDFSKVFTFIEYWEKIKPKIKKSNLKLSKEDFFKNSINIDVDEHDHLHTLLSFPPVYTLLLKEGEDVELDPKKWETMIYTNKCRVVEEETMVMAYERFKNKNYRTAYKKQLKENILKHFPRYIGLFAIINYKRLRYPKYNYQEILTIKLNKNGVSKN